MIKTFYQWMETNSWPPAFKQSDRSPSPAPLPSWDRVPKDSNPDGDDDWDDWANVLIGRNQNDDDDDDYGGDNPYFSSDPSHKQQPEEPSDNDKELGIQRYKSQIASRGYKTAELYPNLFRAAESNPAIAKELQKMLRDKRR